MEQEIHLKDKENSRSGETMTTADRRPRRCPKTKSSHLSRKPSFLERAKDVFLSSSSQGNSESAPKQSLGRKLSRKSSFLEANPIKKISNLRRRASLSTSDVHLVASRVLTWTSSKAEEEFLSRKIFPHEPKNSSTMNRTGIPGDIYFPVDSDDFIPVDFLEGCIDLRVVLPSKKIIRLPVERRTPMMDLLVHLCTAHKLSPGSHVLQVMNERSDDFLYYKPSTPIGALDASTIHVIPKHKINDSIVRKIPMKMLNKPFETTFRLKVHLPRSQLYVVRVSPKATIGQVLERVCKDKDLNEKMFEICDPDHLDEKLNSSYTLSDYQLTEVALHSRGKNNQISRFGQHNLSVSSNDILKMQQNMAKAAVLKRENLKSVNGTRSKLSTGDSSVSSESLGERSNSPEGSSSIVVPATPQTSATMVPPVKKKQKRKAPPPPSGGSGPPSKPNQNEALPKPNNNISVVSPGASPSKAPSVQNQTRTNNDFIGSSNLSAVSASGSMLSLASAAGGRKKKAAPRPPSKSSVQVPEEVSKKGTGRKLPETPRDSLDPPHPQPAPRQSLTGQTDSRSPSKSPEPVYGVVDYSKKKKYQQRSLTPEPVYHDKPEEVLIEAQKEKTSNETRAEKVEGSKPPAKPERQLTSSEDSDDPLYDRLDRVAVKRQIQSEELPAEHQVASDLNSNLKIKEEETSVDKFAAEDTKFDSDEDINIIPVEAMGANATISDHATKDVPKVDNDTVELSKVEPNVAATSAPGGKMKKSKRKATPAINTSTQYRPVKDTLDKLPDPLGEEDEPSGSEIPSITINAAPIVEQPSTKTDQTTHSHSDSNDHKVKPPAKPPRKASSGTRSDVDPTPRSLVTNGADTPMEVDTNVVSLQSHDESVPNASKTGKEKRKDSGANQKGEHSFDTVDNPAVKAPGRNTPDTSSSSDDEPQPKKGDQLIRNPLALGAKAKTTSKQNAVRKPVETESVTKDTTTLNKRAVKPKADDEKKSEQKEGKKSPKFLKKGEIKKPEVPQQNASAVPDDPGNKEVQSIESAENLPNFRMAQATNVSLVMTKKKKKKHPKQKRTIVDETGTHTMEDGTTSSSSGESVSGRRESLRLQEQGNISDNDDLLEDLHLFSKVQKPVKKKVIKKKKKINPAAIHGLTPEEEKQLEEAKRAEEDQKILAEKQRREKIQKANEEREAKRMEELEKIDKTRNIRIQRDLRAKAKKEGIAEGVDTTENLRHQLQILGTESLASQRSTTRTVELEIDDNDELLPTRRNHGAQYISSSSEDEAEIAKRAVPISQPAGSAMNHFSNGQSVHTNHRTGLESNEDWKQNTSVPVEEAQIVATNDNNENHELLERDEVDKKSAISDALDESFANIDEPPEFQESSEEHENYEPLNEVHVLEETPEPPSGFKDSDIVTLSSEEEDITESKRPKHAERKPVQIKDVDTSSSEDDLNYSPSVQKKVVVPKKLQISRVDSDSSDEDSITEVKSDLKSKENGINLKKPEIFKVVVDSSSGEEPQRRKKQKSVKPDTLRGDLGLEKEQDLHGVPKANKLIKPDTDSSDDSLDIQSNLKGEKGKKVDVGPDISVVDENHKVSKQKEYHPDVTIEKSTSKSNSQSDSLQDTIKELEIERTLASQVQSPKEIRKQAEIDIDSGTSDPEVVEEQDEKMTKSSNQQPLLVPVLKGPMKFSIDSYDSRDRKEMPYVKKLIRTESFSNSAKEWDNVDVNHQQMSLVTTFTSSSDDSEAEVVLRRPQLPNKASKPQLPPSQSVPRSPKSVDSPVQYSRNPSRQTSKPRKASLERTRIVPNDDYVLNLKRKSSFGHVEPMATTGGVSDFRQVRLSKAKSMGQNVDQIGVELREIEVNLRSINDEPPKVKPKPSQAVLNTFENIKRELLAKPSYSQPSGLPSSESEKPVLVRQSQSSPSYYPSKPKYFTGETSIEEVRRNANPAEVIVEEKRSLKSSSYPRRNSPKAKQNEVNSLERVKLRSTKVDMKSEHPVNAFNLSDELKQQSRYPTGHLISNSPGKFDDKSINSTSSNDSKMNRERNFHVTNQEAFNNLPPNLKSYVNKTETNQKSGKFDPKVMVAKPWRRPSLSQLTQTEHGQNVDEYGPKKDAGKKVPPNVDPIKPAMKEALTQTAPKKPQFYFGQPDLKSAPAHRSLNKSTAIEKVKNNEAMSHPKNIVVNPGYRIKDYVDPVQKSGKPSFAFGDTPPLTPQSPKPNVPAKPNFKLKSTVAKPEPEPEQLVEPPVKPVVINYSKFIPPEPNPDFKIPKKKKPNNNKFAKEKSQDEIRFEFEQQLLSGKASLRPYENGIASASKQNNSKDETDSGISMVPSPPPPPPEFSTDHFENKPSIPPPPPSLPSVSSWKSQTATGKKIVAPKNKNMDASTDNRANLMAAIRAAGGMNGLRKTNSGKNL